jgi:hypothetical protein
MSTEPVREVTVVNLTLRDRTRCEIRRRDDATNRYFVNAREVSVTEYLHAVKAAQPSDAQLRGAA